MFTDTLPQQPIRPARHFHMVDDVQVEQLACGTLEILEEVGVHCPSEKCLRIYWEHGAHVDFEDQIVRLRPDLVTRFLSRAPRYYKMGARSPQNDLDLDGTAMY